MPIIKSVPVRTTVQKSLAYILNPDKTEQLLYTASLNCMTDAADAYLNMKAVYELYSGRSFDEPLPKTGNASILISNGVDVKTVQGCLGHSSATTTLNIYAHSFQAAQVRAMDSVADCILKRNTKSSA